MSYNKQHNVYLKAKYRIEYWAALSEIKVLTAPYVPLNTTPNDLVAMAVIAWRNMLREAKDIEEALSEGGNDDGSTP